MGEERSTKVQLSPVLRAALSSRQPGEDLDEALLRALKAEHPEHAVTLLSAVTGMIEMEMKRTGEDREQVVQRLAAEDPGPHVEFKVLGDGPLQVDLKSTVIWAGGKEYHSLEELPRHLRQTMVVRAGGKEYRSLDELPPDLRRAVEAALPPGMRTTLGAARAEGQPAPLEQDKRVQIVRGAGSTARTGCAMAPLLALWRLMWR